MSNTGSVQIDFGSAPGTDYSEIIITGQTGITTSNKVDAWKNIESTSNHSLLDVVVSDFDIYAGSIVNGVGFTIYVISRMGRLTGQYNISWCWA